MMKTSVKVLAALSACAVCAVMAGGAAYASAPSTDEADAQVVTETAKASIFDEAPVAEDTQEITVESSAILDAAQQISSIDDTATAVVAAADEAYEIANPPLAPMSLEIFGSAIPYVDYFGARSAPSATGGLWMGSDSTTDGSWGYFIGHHPGVFNCVMDLVAGDQVTVCDRNGNEATYTVFAVYDVPNTTYWEDIEGRITSHGESITLQTCVGDGCTYRIVQAA